MSESTDPQLAGQCAHCGKFYTRRHFTNQHGQSALGRIVRSKYCSPVCRYAAAKGRSGRGHARTDAGHSSGCLPPSLATPPALAVPLKADLPPADAFERLREGKVLSSWKPSGDGKDMPELPEFLRRPLPAQQAC